MSGYSLSTQVNAPYDDAVAKTLFDNPVEFFSHCNRFQPRLDLEPLPIESFQR